MLLARDAIYIRAREMLRDADARRYRRLNAATSQPLHELIYRVRLPASRLAGEVRVRTRLQYRKRLALCHSHTLSDNVSDVTNSRFLRRHSRAHSRRLQRLG